MLVCLYFLSYYYYFPQVIIINGLGGVELEKIIRLIKTIQWFTIKGHTIILIKTKYSDLTTKL